MSINFTIDLAVKAESLIFNSLLPLCKQNKMLRYLEIKFDETKLTEKIL